MNNNFGKKKSLDFSRTSKTMDREKQLNQWGLKDFRLKPVFKNHEIPLYIWSNFMRLGYGSSNVSLIRGAGRGRAHAESAVALGEADDAARLRQPGGWDSWTIIALLRGDETAPSNFKCGSLLAAVSYRLWSFPSNKSSLSLTYRASVAENTKASTTQVGLLCWKFAERVQFPPPYKTFASPGELISRCSWKGPLAFLFRMLRA